MRFQSAISFILFSAVSLVRAAGFTPTTLLGGWNQGKASSATTRAEPSFTEKFGRRLNVYWLASRVFFDYKQAQRKESRLKRKLGIAEDSDSDDDPSVTLLWNNIHERNADKLTKKIVNLEGFWIKVGQYLSSRSDVMPSEYIARLTSLQDSMPPKAFEDVMLTLHEEFTEEEMLLLHYIDPSPLSTASLAQVHRATLKNGRQVVLKVQHRGVASLMLQDMENLKSILNMVAKFEPDSDFTSIIQEYNKEVRKELDFRTEAENMNEVRKLLQEQNIRAIVPDVVPELVKERVLVMDFCEGFTIRDLDALDSNGVDRELLLKRVCDSWAAQMHVGGVFNADPHPGNILVSTSEIDGDASVPVLLDFGLTKRLETDAKLAFAKLMHASDETDVDALLQSFEEMGLEMNRYDPFEDMSAMQRSFGSTIPQSKAKQMQKENSEQYKERMEALREDQGVQKGQKLRNPVDAWPAELVFFGRVTNMLKGLCSRLDVAHPYLNTMANAARQTLREAVPIEDRADRLIHSSADTIDTPLQRRLIDAVHQLQDQDEMVGLQVCVLSQGKELANIAGGVLGTANPRPVTPSTLFCVFSVSKALLSIGMLRLVQENRISLDDPVVHYWPAFAENGKNEVTIRHVLTHQAGLANALPDDASLDVLLDWERMKGVIEKAIPDHKPGERTMYHYLTYAWICGGLIEQVTGAPYEEYLSNILKVPLRNLDNNLFLAGIPKDANPEALAVLSMERRQESTGAAQTAGSSSNKAPGKAEEGKKVLQKYRGREQLMNPSVFNMRRVREAKLPSANGHASAAALAAVFDSLLQAKSPLLEDTILEAARHHNMQVSPLDEALLLDNSGASFGLGLQLHEFDMEGGNKATAFGHSGIGGSIVLSLPEANLTVAIVTNRLSQNSKVRQTLLDIVLDDFGLEVPQSLQGS